MAAYRSGRVGVWGWCGVVTAVTATLLVAACGGDAFSSTDSAAGGSGGNDGNGGSTGGATTGGTTAGGTTNGGAGGQDCNVPCAAPDCVGAYVPFGECCPVCPPTSCPTGYSCADQLCPPGTSSTPLAAFGGECCACRGDSCAVDCGAPPMCPGGSRLEQLPGECCPRCTNSTCPTGQDLCTNLSCPGTSPIPGDAQGCCMGCGDGAVDCSTALTALRERADKNIDSNLFRKCQADADCTSFNVETACGTLCNVVVSTGAAERVTVAITEDAKAACAACPSPGTSVCPLGIVGPTCDMTLGVCR